jgi:D-alanyl-D-alanine carboxypeptidase
MTGDDMKLHKSTRFALAAATLLLAACGGGGDSGQVPDVLPQVSRSPAGLVQADNRDVDSYVQAKLKEGNIPGLSLAVIDNGRLLYAKSYGYGNWQTGEPVRPEQRFEIGSISKPFAAVAVMLLVEDGKIGLDDKISKYIGPVLPSWEQITVRHLLNHTSGLPEYPTDASRQIIEGTRIVPEDEILTIYKTFPALRAPGESWSYSNVGFDVLGILIGRVSGKYYGDFLQERVFGPLGMRDTRIMSAAEPPPGKVSGYYLDERQQLRIDKPSPALRNYGSLAASGIEASVMDMAKFDAALSGDSLLTQASRDAMWAAGPLLPRNKPSAPDTYFGLGWFLATTDGHRRIFHSGGMPGYICDIVRYRDDGISVVVLSNQGYSALPIDMSRAVAKLFRPNLPN